MKSAKFPTLDLVQSIEVDRHIIAEWQVDHVVRL